MSHTENGSASYELPDFGLLYDAIPAYDARPDVTFYVEEALAANGAVLELGCGTGRVLIPTARAGVPMTGLDGSTAMLARCREKLADEPFPVRERVALHAGDGRDFSLGATFPLVTAQFRMMQHLVAVDDQLACLRSVHRHVAPGGRFVFDVFNPNFASFARDRSAEAEDTPPTPIDGGRTLRRSARIPRTRNVEQVVEVELFYDVTSSDGETTRHVHAFDMRWYLPAELTHLLARAGFAVHTMYGGFDRSPLRDDSPEIIVVAERLTDQSP